MNHTATELRAAAGKCGDGAQVRRMLALALVLQGRPRTGAAQQNGMDRRKLRDRVHRYNSAGIEGLQSSQSSSPPPAQRAREHHRQVAAPAQLEPGAAGPSHPQEDPEAETAFGTASALC